MKEKNLPKLKKEILKLFGSSLSLSSNVSLPSNVILPTDTETAPLPNGAGTATEKPEDINITIALPQDKKTRNYKKTVKSLKNNKSYNIDIKKNDIPLQLYFNNSYEDHVTPELVKPVNFINYGINRIQNTNINSPQFNESKVVNKNNTTEVSNVKNNFIKEYVKIIENYKSNTKPNQNFIQKENKVLNNFFIKPYTFLTNSDDVILRTENNITNNSDITNQSNPVTNNSSITNQSNPVTNNSSITNQSNPVTNNSSITNQSNPVTNNSSITNQSNPVTNNSSITNQSNPVTNSIITNQSNAVTNNSAITNQSNAVTNNSAITNQSNPVTNNSTRIEKNTVNTTNAIVQDVSNNNAFIDNNVTFFKEPKYFDLSSEINQPIINRFSSIKNVLQHRTISNYLQSNNVTNVPAFESGGIVSKPTLAMIGEKEPEVIIPKSILPNLLTSSDNSPMEKTKINRKINSFIDQGNISSLPALKSIDQNNKTKNLLEVEKEEIEHMRTIRNADKKQPKPTAVSNELQSPEETILGVEKITSTRGIKQFAPPLNGLPSWRQSTV
jgi:hypothetical protein